VRKLIAAVVVLVGVALLADFGSAAYAEFRVSRELRSTLSLAADPDVRINGFPFLTQAVAGDYRSVDVRASGVPVTGFGEVTVEATLRGVRVPFSDVVSGRVSRVVADSVQARVRIGATDLGRYLRVPDLEVSEPPRAPGTNPDAPRTTVVLTGTVDVVGLRKKVSVDASLSLTAAGGVAVTATRLDLGADGGRSSLAESVVSALLARLSVTLDPSTVPFGILPTAVRAEGSEIVVAGTGTDVTVVGGPGGT
jgi:hypothetical protein